MADWTPEQVEAIVADYLAMWDKDLRGLQYNKAEHNRQLQKRIKRSEGAVEKKHQNISAVFWHLGYPYLRGYKRLPNYQNYLRTVIEGRLENEPSLNHLVARAVQAAIKTTPPVRKIKDTRVPPPPRREIESLLKFEARKRTNFAPRNYLEMEAQNQSLGLAGEEFILKYEKEYLVSVGKHDLAKRVEHVSRTTGDYLGFDILSFETDGCEKLIEVKTTRYGALTRFFASTNEVDVSKKRKDQYQLYRLFNFDKGPQFFVLAGSLSETCQLKPATYSATPHS